MLRPSGGLSEKNLGRWGERRMAVKIENTDADVVVD